MSDIPAANTAPARTIPDSASLPAPWSYAYQYHDCIRFSHGREINGSKPIKAVGLYREEDVRAILAASADAQKVLGFYASAENYEKQLIAEKCGCCFYWHDAKIGKDGDQDNAARAFLKRAR